MKMLLQLHRRCTNCWIPRVYQGCSQQIISNSCKYYTQRQIGTYLSLRQDGETLGISYSLWRHIHTTLSKRSVMCAPTIHRRLLSTINDSDKQEPAVSNDDNDVCIYESPMAVAVHKLRAVSLVTAIIGSVGFPLIVSLKNADISTGLLAMGSIFVTCSIGSTIIVNIFFSPYVYRIDKIPIRKCNGTNAEDTNIIDTTTIAPEPNTEETARNKPVLYKAVTKSLFLQNIETVFDPINDMKPYVNGMHPLCNLVVTKSDGDIRLYVHEQFVNDITIRSILEQNSKRKINETKNNPEDDLF